MSVVQELTNLSAPLYSIDLKTKSHEAVQKIKTSATNAYNKITKISKYKFEVAATTALGTGYALLSYGLSYVTMNPIHYNVDKAMTTVYGIALVIPATFAVVLRAALERKNT